MALDNREINALLQELRANPYRLYVIETPHTGYLRKFLVKGEEVHGPRGRW